MKTLTIIIIAVLALQANVLTACSAISLPIPTEGSTFTPALLAPSTPMEATFEDDVQATGYAALVPFIPAEASFEDAGIGVLMMDDLTPVVPTVAAFDDEVMTNDYSSLVPVVPMEADFE